MKQLLAYLILLVLAAGTAQSCYYDHESLLYHTPPVDCTTVNAKFAADVQPIINLHCATPSCHNSTGAGNTVLQSYEQIKGKADRIYTRTLVSKTMPPSGSLTPSELNSLQCWLTSGAPNN